jgi:cytochrome o ubiquinol oxidase subunit IV
MGLLLAVILTATSFWVANTSVIWAPGVTAGLAVLAIAQMGVHLVFFLHITTGPDSTNNILALAFGVLIVLLIVAGSLVIMANLNENMVAHTELIPKEGHIDVRHIASDRASGHTDLLLYSARMGRRQNEGDAGRVW